MSAETSAASEGRASGEKRKREQHPANLRECLDGMRHAEYKKRTELQATRDFLKFCEIVRDWREDHEGKAFLGGTLHNHITEDIQEEYMPPWEELLSQTHVGRLLLKATPIARLEWLPDKEQWDGEFELWGVRILDLFCEALRSKSSHLVAKGKLCNLCDAIDEECLSSDEDSVGTRFETAFNGFLDAVRGDSFVKHLETLFEDE